MVDRITVLDPEARVIRADAPSPSEVPVFEGHFPGHPLLPGVLMIETMAQTGGWLVLATLRFARMPFLPRSKEAKFRGLRHPRPEAGSRGAAGAGWLRLRRGEPADRPRPAEGGRGRDPLRRRALPQRDAAAQMLETARRVGACPRHICQRHTRVAPDRDALITGIGLVSCLGEGAEAHWAALDAPGGFTPVVDTDTFRPLAGASDGQRSTWTSRSPSAATSGRWRPGSASACTPPASRWTPPGSRATPTCCQRMDMIVAAGGGERDYAADDAILAALRHAADPGAMLNERLLARSAADAVPGAALQPAGGQYFAGARRGRLLAHLHGRGSVRAPTRCAPPAHGSRRGRATCSWSAVRSMPSAPTR